MIATSVAYDLVFLLHVLAGVDTIIVLLAMRWAALLVARGADAAAQQARFAQHRNWAARVLHVMPVTGLILSLSGGGDVSPTHVWVILGMACYLAAAGHLEARTLPLERSVARVVQNEGEAPQPMGRELVTSIDILLVIIAVAFVAMLVQF